MLDLASFHARFGEMPVFGMVHLLPLPGAPLFGGSIAEVIDHAVGDAKAIAEGGAAGLVIENFGDKPFGKTVQAETIAAMSRVIGEIAREVTIPFGVNALRSDGLAALAIAVATGAAFIRINVHSGAMLTDQGVIEGDAATVLRRRRELGAASVAIFADHLVKHAAPIAAIDPAQSAKDLRYRGLADAIVGSGAETGGEADPHRFVLLRSAVPDAPLLIGSGLTEMNARRYRGLIDGAIVGTSLKRDGDVAAPVERARVRAVVDAVATLL
ncbi:MAG: BtpA/SgcQ family protein [Acidobacteria bacterium]|nr:BtpA/SgcQ family protein [Acidobacteriota bacterium]